MNKNLGLLASAGLVAAVALTVACGDSSNTGGSGGSATTSTVSGTTHAATTGNGTTTTTHAATTGNGTTTATSTGTGVTDDCASYCSIITANCTGNDKQYDSAAACMTACTAAALPAGTVADTGGHTLGCHIYHAGAAAMTPDVHCWHAGLPGYADSSKAAPGPCE